MIRIHLAAVGMINDGGCRHGRIHRVQIDGLLSLHRRRVLGQQREAAPRLVDRSALVTANLPSREFISVWRRNDTGNQHLRIISIGFPVQRNIECLLILVVVQRTISRIV